MSNISITKKITVLLLLVLMAVSLYGKKKKEILFPEREYIKKHSKLFFKKVNLTFPGISRAVFFVKSDAYRSAFINLSETVSKSPFLEKIMPDFQARNRALIEKFDNDYKSKLRIENSVKLPAEFNVNKSTYQLLILSSIYNDYYNSKLSGNNAFRLWCIFLAITDSVCKEKVKAADNAAVLMLSSHLVFFKKAKKWQKKARKILRKLPPGSAAGPDITLILQN